MGTSSRSISETRPDVTGARAAPLRVLIIDDDQKLCSLLQDFLEGEGFQVVAENSGLAGLGRAGEADLIVLDMMLPDLDGISVLRRIRAKSATPVIVLTARGEEEDRIDGLEAGADDYLSKPFSVRELSARMRAVWRRTRVRFHANLRTPIKVGPLLLDPGARKVFRNGIPVPMTTLEFDILELLLRSAGRVVSRDELSLHIYNRIPGRFDRSIDMHVSHLRRKVDGDMGIIQTVRGAGYQFCAGGSNE
jgi:two-component system response regulator CpxR